MRISDWSSDVCSSDLTDNAPENHPPRRALRISHRRIRILQQRIGEHEKREAEAPQCGDRSGALQTRIRETERCENAGEGDRKSVVEGKSVSVRVDLGGRRIIKKQRRNAR